MAQTLAGVEGISIEQWSSLDEDEPGELVDGHLVDEEGADLAHETVVAWLIAVLRGWLIPRGGYVFGSEVKYALSRRRGRKPDVTKPDVTAFFPGRGPLPRHGAVAIPPDVAVEVVSPSPRDGRRDRIEKVDEYAAFGVAYYWLIDPDQRTLEVREFGPDGRSIHALGAADGIVERVPGCEGLRLDLDTLWAEIDLATVCCPNDDCCTTRATALN